jgi:peptidoglycan hydrolase CwlO-like protein
MKLEEQLRNDAQSLRELGWFNRAIMMDAGADEIRRLATANKKLREGCEEQKQRIKRLEEALDKTSKAACKHIKQLESEVYALRLYGNKDCTAMADQALKEAKP